MEFKQQLVNDLSATDGWGNPSLTVTVHETANTSRGANAQAHANLQSRGNSRDASWQYTVDDTQAIQSYDDAVKCWHSSRTVGNRTSVAVEICVNSDGDYVKAVKNAAELVARILKSHAKGTEAVLTHEDWSGKNCPTRLLAGTHGITWNQFIALIQQHLNGAAPVQPAVPVREEVIEMKLWHTITPWGEHVYGYTTVEAGAGPVDVNVYQHLAYTWPAVDLPWNVWQTEISEAWRRKGLDDEAVANKVSEIIETLVPKEA